MSLPAFTEYPTCAACNYTRGPEIKPLLKWCPGAPQEGGRTAEECPLGGGEPHHHTQCLRCSFTWAMALAGGEPGLTGEEIRDLRELLRQARAAG